MHVLDLIRSRLSYLLLKREEISRLLQVINNRPLSDSRNIILYLQIGELEQSINMLKQQLKIAGIIYN